nr:FAD-dependent oxidoreductase [Sediminibacillus massiliensis]
MKKQASQSRMPQFPEPYWRESVELPQFPSLQQDIEVDIGIVGAGITGITAAYLLTKKGFKVALLDAGKILNGTTGHTTAKITAQHGLIYDELIQNFGLETATAYYDFNKESMEFMKEVIKEHNIDCDYEIQDAFVYTESDHYVNQLKKELQAYEQIGIPRKWAEDIPLDLPVKAAVAMKDQAQFHPLKYLAVLVEYIEENGGLIFEDTTAVNANYGKKPMIITRENYKIHCNKIIAASHFPFVGAEAFFSARMHPQRSYVIAVKAGKKYPGGMYINAEQPSRSLRNFSVNGEEYWLVGGEGHKTGQGGNTIDYYDKLLDFAQTNFGVEEYGYRWSAQDLVTLDKMPFIGKVTDDQPDILVATGFKKWGITQGTGAAMLISDIISNTDNRYQELFAPTRFHADPDLKEFIKTNSNVSKELIKGKLEYTRKNIEDVGKDEAAVIRIKGMRTGVYRDTDGKVHLVDTTCTHLGCEVNWNSGDRTWDCPCHGSRFSISGEVIEGPAKEPLKKKDNL